LPQFRTSTLLLDCMPPAIGHPTEWDPSRRQDALSGKRLDDSQNFRLILIRAVSCESSCRGSKSLMPVALKNSHPRLEANQAFGALIVHLDWFDGGEWRPALIPAQTGLQRQRFPWRHFPMAKDRTFWPPPKSETNFHQSLPANLQFMARGGSDAGRLLPQPRTAPASFLQSRPATHSTSRSGLGRSELSLASETHASASICGWPGTSTLPSTVARHCASTFCETMPGSSARLAAAEGHFPSANPETRPASRFVFKLHGTSVTRGGFLPCRRTAKFLQRQGRTNGIDELICRPAPSQCRSVLARGKLGPGPGRQGQRRKSHKLGIESACAETGGQEKKGRLGRP